MDLFSRATQAVSLNERARKSIAQEQATDNDFEQSAGFREDLCPPTFRPGRKDCSTIALGHLKWGAKTQNT